MPLYCIRGDLQGSTEIMEKEIQSTLFLEFELIDLFKNLKKKA